MMISIIFNCSPPATVLGIELHNKKPAVQEIILCCRFFYMQKPRSRSRRAQKGERFGRFAPRHDSRPEWSSIGNSSHRGRLPVRCRCGFAKGAARWGRQGLRCPHCVRDDYGGQRERSGIARAAVPRRAGPDVSRGAIRCPSGSQAVFCVRPLWWTGELSTSRQTPGERIHHRCQARADRHPAPVVRQLSCSGRSVLQSPAHAGAQVFALLPRG